MADTGTVAAVASTIGGAAIAVSTAVATIIAARRRAGAEDTDSLTARVTELQGALRRLEVAYNELTAYTVRLWRWALVQPDLPEQFQDPPPSLREPNQ